MDQDTSDTTAGQPPAPGDNAGPAPAGGKRERKAPSPEQARLAAERKRLKRQMEKLLADGDAEAIAAAARKLAGEGGEAPAAASEPAALERREEAPAAAEKPANAPTAEEVAAMVPVAQSMVAMVAGSLKGTRFDPMKPSPNPLGGDDIIPARALTEALAPVLAKYLPAAVATPEGQLALVAVMWLGPPTVELVKEKMTGGGDTAGTGSAGIRAA